MRVEQSSSTATVKQWNTSKLYGYTTNVGNYTFPKTLPYLMMYNYSKNLQSVAFSTFLLNSTSALPVPVSSTVSVKPTLFQTNGTIKNFGLQVKGYLSITVDFAKSPPKITAKFSPVGTYTWNLFWVVAGYSHVAVSPTSIQNIDNNQRYVGTNSSFTMHPGGTASDDYLIVSMKDYGPAKIYSKTYSISTYSKTAAIVVFPKGVAIIDPSLVQTKNASSLAVTFTSGTTVGYLIVLVACIIDTTTTQGTATVADDQSNSYTSMSGSSSAAVSKVGASNAMGMWIWYATAGGTSAETITITYSRTRAAGSIQAYEVSSATGTGSGYATGSGSGTPMGAPSTGSQAFSGSPFLVAGVCAGEGTVPTLGAGTGFTAAGGDANSEHEYATTGITSPTTFPFTVSGGSGTNYWAEAGAFFPAATVTQPITITVANSGPSATATLSGCSVSPTTEAMDGTQRNFTADPSCTITVTMPSDGASSRYRTSSSATTYTIATCASGTCSVSSTTVYNELKQTWTITAKGASTFDASMTCPLTGTLAGTGSTTLSTFAPSTNASSTASSTYSWADYNRQVSFCSTLSGAPTSTQWAGATPLTFTQTTGGNTNNVDFWKQGSMTSSYSISDALGVCSAPTLTYNSLGSQTTYTLTTTGTAKFIDWGSTPTTTNPLTGSTSSERCVTTFSMPAVSAGGTINPAYKHQYLLTNAQSLSVTRTNNGTSSAITANGFVDAATSLSVAATYTCSFTIQNASFVYQFTPSGLQLFASASSSDLSDFTGNASPYVTFSETGHAIICVPAPTGLTVSRVVANGSPASYTQSSDLTKLYFTANTANEVDFTKGGGGGGGSSGASSDSSGTVSSGGGGGGGGGGGSSITTTTSTSTTTLVGPPPPIGTEANLILGTEALVGILLATVIFSYVQERRDLVLWFDKRLGTPVKEFKRKRKRGFF